jgi:hypothetical protein
LKPGRFSNERLLEDVLAGRSQASADTIAFMSDAIEIKRRVIGELKQKKDRMGLLSFHGHEERFDVLREIVG